MRSQRRLQIEEKNGSQIGLQNLRAPAFPSIKTSLGIVTSGQLIGACMHTCQNCCHFKSQCVSVYDVLCKQNMGDERYVCHVIYEYL